MSHSPIVAGATVADRFRVEAAAPDGSFRATDARSGREVVLRVFAAEWSGEERLRFRRHALAAARVAHPNVAALLDSGADEALGAEWIAWEALAGEPLAALLAQRGTPPAALALRILQEAAAGIAAGHQAGVAHGEVHPGTLFLSRGEDDRRMRVRVLGLGARAGLQPRSAAARYASPEALRREEAGAAGDVFSLGVVAYELLAGLPAQWGATLASMARGHSARVPALPAHVPAPLAGVVLRALEADPSRRFPDAAAFADALTRATTARAEAPTRIAAPGWTIAPVTVAAADLQEHLYIPPALVAAEEPRPAYQPRRAPRFMVEQRESRPGYLAGGVVTLILLGALGWIATREPAPPPAPPPAAEVRGSHRDTGGTE